MRRETYAAASANRYKSMVNGVSGVHPLSLPVHLAGSLGLLLSIESPAMRLIEEEPEVLA